MFMGLATFYMSPQEMKKYQSGQQAVVWLKRTGSDDMSLQLPINYITFGERNDRAFAQLPQEQ